MKIIELKEGMNERITFLIKSLTIKTACTGSNYAEVEARDEAFQDFTMKVFEGPDVELISGMKGKMASAQVCCQMYNKKLSYTAKGVKEEPDVKPFIKHAPFSSSALYKKLVDVIDRTTTDGRLAAVAKAVLEDYKEQLLCWSGAKSYHHNYMGGLLWHTFCVTYMAEKVASFYKLDAELLVCAAVLHDVGKMKELDTDEMGDAEFTVPGTLDGHIVLSRDIARDKMMEIYGKEENWRTFGEPLLHCISAHHGRKDWGSPVEPKIPEAKALSLLDVLDSQMDMYKDALERLEEGEVSPYLSRLEGYVYKNVPREAEGEQKS